MSQSDSNVSPPAADDAVSARSRSWWLTLPGLLTGLAGLISAITGLVVAVQQLRPSHAAAPPTQTSAPATNPSSPDTSASTAPASRPSTVGGAALTRPVGLRASFPAGRHVEINGLRYDVLTASVSAGNPGQVTLALHVRMTNPGRYPANFWNATFRLRVGAGTNAPTGFLDDVVEGGTTDVGTVDFTVPASTRQATLLVGDDYTKAIALPIALKGG